MPKENKHSRGRRDEKKLKRKREKGEGEEAEPKRRKPEDAAGDEDVLKIFGTDNADVPFNEGLVDVEVDGETGAERPFYGMLEDEEQEYFRRADELLELNDFPSEEERSMFLTSVYWEAEGKELKIACSQSCSRLMERLILLSTTNQKKKLFEKFSGNFSHLVQHRFASHCCETLFVQSAAVVTEELTADEGEVELVDGEMYVSMENLFLYTLNELEGSMTFLLTDRFASHTLRVLLVILSGRPLEQTATRTLLQSKKKEKIGITGHSTAPTEFTLSKRAVPSSFQFAVEKIISDTIATMDTSFIRVLATHPTGNPSLQLLLELELTNPNTKKGLNSDQKTIISSLLPDDITVEGSESSVFVNGILYDPIGSRLLETIMTHAPGKQFKQIYRTVFKERIAGLARNEISSYVVIKVFNRLSREDLEEAAEQIHPQILGLIERRRTVIIKVLLERCHARGASTEALTKAIAASYGDDPKTLVLKMAAIDDIRYLITATKPPAAETEMEATEGEDEVKKPATAPILPPKPIPSQIHGSVLAQSMLTLPGLPSTIIQNGLLALPSSHLLALSLWTTTSHIIQTALSPTLNVSFRRKLINVLLFPQPTSTSETEQTTETKNPILALALSPTGSHVLDSILSTTTSTTPTSTSAPLFTLTERVALILITYEVQLRDSWTGRIIWRNWSLDLFKRRRGDWVKKVKEAGIVASVTVAALNIAADKQQEEDVNEDGDATVVKKTDQTSKKGKRGKKDLSRNKDAAKTSTKSAIQLAREKFAAAKVVKAAGGGFSKSKGKGKAGEMTGANAVAVGTES